MRTASVAGALSASEVGGGTSPDFSRRSKAVHQAVAESQRLVRFVGYLKLRWDCSSLPTASPNRIQVEA